MGTTSLCLSVHRTVPPPELPRLRDRMEGRRSGGMLPEPIAAGILSLIDRLPPGGGVCHGDVHPGNVVMTAEGPRFIDWTGATRAPAGFDLACCHVLNAELAPDHVSDPEPPRANDAATQAEYARLAGMSPAALTAAMEPYLPIMRAFVLLGPAGSPAFRERLTQQVEAAVRAGG